MVDYVRTVLRFSCIGWISSIILMGVTSSGNCSESADADHLVIQFNDFNGALESSNSPLEEAKKFFEEFISQVNLQYGLTLTIQNPLSSSASSPSSSGVISINF